MVVGVEAVAGQDVVVEQAAVVHHPRDHLHPVADRGVEGQLAGPGLEGFRISMAQSITSP